MLSALRNKLIFFAGKLAPGWSNSRIDALLLIPKSSMKPSRVPRNIRQFELKSKDGEIRAYQIGKGPTVVFVHGWGGRAPQFFALMQGLAQIGFTALAFDHLGHGQSESKRADLHQFIATTNYMLHYAANKTPDGLYAIVGHSTGCIAITNARPAILKDVPLLLISPIFNFRLFFLKRLVKLNFHPDLLKQYINRFAKVYQREFSKLELGRSLTRYSDVTAIVHDRSDTQSPATDSIKFCKRYPLTRLLLTREYDHDRVINSESVWQELKSHLNYEDTTINFADKILIEIL